MNDLDLDDLFNDTFIRPIPDGAIQIQKINKNEFRYRLQINDNRIFVYHRSNGVTLTKIFNHVTDDYGPVYY